MNDDDALAGEYVLGLLEGADLLAARARVAEDPDFAASVAAWEIRLAPLLDEIGPVDASPEMWRRIEAALDEPDTGAQVIALRTRVRLWQGAAFAAAAAAVIAFIVPVMPPGPDALPPQAMERPPLVASVPITDTPLRLAVTYLPDREELLISAVGVPGDGVHDHELWLVPEAGAAISLGVVRPDAETRVAIADRLAQLMSEGSKLVLTREPLGGAPEGASAGPAVGQGVLSRI